MKPTCIALAILLAGSTLLLGAEIGPGGYEMTTYYLALLHRGPNWTAAVTPEAEAIQRAHLANIRQMAESGKLVLAGPFTDESDLLGIFVFQGVTREEAARLCANDPAVKAGRLRVELHPWYAAKGIRVDPPTHPPAK